MTDKPKLLLATTNRGKRREYQNLLQGVPYSIVTPDELNISADVEENGDSYEENAVLKAATLAEISGLLTLADDSGLEVDALGGEPGIRSARYAGEKASDIDRNNYLLDKLKNVPEEKRTAHFVCVIAIVQPGEKARLFKGECRGSIAKAPRGDHGHGYDPVFYVPELQKTMAELTMEEKNKVSHRAKAAEKAVKYLRKM
jgi:XTP/dITP diphosphohydrolase